MVIQKRQVFLNIFINYGKIFVNVCIYVLDLKYIKKEKYYECCCCKRCPDWVWTT